MFNVLKYIQLSGYIDSTRNDSQTEVSQTEAACATFYQTIDLEIIT